MIRKALALGPLLAVTAGFAWTAGLQAQKVIPLTMEPRHRLMMDGDPVKVLDVRIPPGDTSFFHVHDAPILLVGMSNPLNNAQVLTPASRAKFSWTTRTSGHDKLNSDPGNSRTGRAPATTL